MLVLLGLLIIAAFLIGSYVFWAALLIWIEGGRTFLNGFADWLYGLLGAAILLVAMLFSGIFLRFMIWPKAPMVSFAISILSVLFIFSCYFIFSGYWRFFDGSNPDDEVVGRLIVIFSLVVVSLPPFLHWRSTRNAWLKPILMAVLALMIVSSTVIGGLVYGFIIDDWVRHDLGANGWQMPYQFNLAEIAAILLLFSMLLSGIFLRLMTGKKASQASLGLCLLSTVFIMLTYWIFYTGLYSGVRLQFLGLASFLIVSLPPFLHWRGEFRAKNER